MTESYLNERELKNFMWKIQLEVITLIKSNSHDEFLAFYKKHEEMFPKLDVAKIYIESGRCGNVQAVDFLLNSNIRGLDINFAYIEGDGYQETIPNGAIFLAAEDHHVPLLEYFIKNDIYYICLETSRGLKQYMPSALKLIEEVEFKIYLEESLNSKTKKVKAKKI